MEDNKKVMEQDTSDNSLAFELLQEVKTQTKRWMIAFFFMVAFCAAMFFGFIWYLNQYDFTSSVEQTGVYTFSDSQGNLISSDISPEQMERILEIINGENKSN